MEKAPFREAGRAPATHLLLLCGVLSAGPSELAAWALAASADGGVVVTVGGDPACDFHTGQLPNALQAAVDTLAADPGGTGPTTIVVARSGNYQGARIVVAGGGHARGLTLRGGYSDCAATAADDTPTLIEGDGSGSGAVFDITGPADGRGSPVVLADLAVVGNSTGPGIRIRSTDVEIRGVQVFGNSGASNGGGIDIGGAGARLHSTGGRISDNVAGSDGGGIHCSAGAVLELAADTAISGNHAGRSGGGIHVDGCSGRIDIGSPISVDPASGLGANTAMLHGGGLAASSSFGPTDLLLGSSSGGNSSSPAIIGNDAGGDGGGVHATGPDTRLLLRNARVLENGAGGHGGGLAAADGARIELRADQRRCPHSERCAQLQRNSAVRGGAVAVRSDGWVGLFGADIADNVAAVAASAGAIEAGGQGSGGGLELGNSFVHGNAGSGELFELSGPGAELRLLQTTVVGTAALQSIVGSGSQTRLLLGRTIIAAPPAVATVEHDAGAMVEVDCSMVHEAMSLAGVLDLQSVVYDTPGFADEMSGDFRLVATAEATDRCAADPRYPPHDFQLERRPWRSALPEAFGPFDIGADEWSPVLFRDGFEG